jgi:signal transduction histidine kinase
MVSWVFLVGPLAHSPDLTLAERVVSMAYPIMDVLLLATVVRLVVDGGPRPPAFWVLCCGVGALLVTDTLYSIIQLTGGYHTGSPIDLGWMTWYACWGATALHPTMTTLAEPAPHREVRLSRWRLGLLAGASLLAPAVQVVQLARREQTEDLVTAVASMVLFGLVLARLQGLAGEVAALATGRKRLLDRTVQAREEERIRLAAELHDGPIQRLTAIGYQLEEASLTLGRGDDRRARTLMTSVQRGLRGEVDQLRGLMATLRPPVLDERGLTLALADELDSFERRTGIACTLKSEHDTRLEPEIETVLYRVVQEALTNVAKHAKARKVSVSLGADDDRVDMQVQDDGVGFDAEQASGMVGSGHFGLAGMRERVELAAGTYHLRSTPGSGTLIHVRVPRRVPA